MTRRKCMSPPIASGISPCTNIHNQRVIDNGAIDSRRPRRLLRRVQTVFSAMETLQLFTMSLSLLPTLVQMLLASPVTRGEATRKKRKLF